MNWITSEKVNDRHNLLPPELFRKTITVCGPLVSADLKVTSMGIYEVSINGEKVSNCYFAPGYTHYESYVQVQTYDVTALLHEGNNVLDIIVANGWWLGTLGNKNNRYGKMRALAAELTLHYAVGTTEIIQTDESWTVTQDTPFRYADFYNGEEIDLTCEAEPIWRFTPAKHFYGKTPVMEPHLGAFVREECRLAPTSVKGNVYDFGQNHAGVLYLIVEAEAGAVITIRHGEILDANGGLFTKNLRKAKATLMLTCKAGVNVFSPRFTYMGYRYVEITCTTAVRIKHLESIVLTSDCAQIGQFSCSDALINRLQLNIQWGQCSNFIDIPTDCPQRDERMGWTGDIAVFAQTAAFNRDIFAFMRKWLKDLRLYQNKNGALPVTIPANKTYEPFPYAQPTAIWGDAATMVPWAIYRAYGNREILKDQYDSMKA